MELTGIVGSNFKDYYEKMIQKNYSDHTDKCPRITSLSADK